MPRPPVTPEVFQEILALAQEDREGAHSKLRTILHDLGRPEDQRFERMLDPEVFGYDRASRAGYGYRIASGQFQITDGRIVALTIWDSPLDVDVYGTWLIVYQIGASHDEHTHGCTMIGKRTRAVGRLPIYRAFEGTPLAVAPAT